MPPPKPPKPHKIQPKKTHAALFNDLLRDLDKPPAPQAIAPNASAVASTPAKPQAAPLTPPASLVQPCVICNDNATLGNTICSACAGRIQTFTNFSALRCTQADWHKQHVTDRFKALERATERPLQWQSVGGLEKRSFFEGLHNAPAPIRHRVLAYVFELLLYA